MAPADRGPGTSELADVGRASSLRRSMLALIDKGGDDAHPANWAPFVVVKALLIEQYAALRGWQGANPISLEARRSGQRM